MSGPQLPEGGGGRHLDHGAALLVRHEQPPQFVVSIDDVFPHVHSSQEDFVPKRRLLRYLDVVECFARPSQPRSPSSVVSLESTELLEGFIFAQMLPVVYTAIQLLVNFFAAT